MEHGKAGTTAQAAVRRLRRSLFSRYGVLLVAAVILGSLLSPCFADEPAPDSSGTVTGDRNTTTDAAGNPFVVPAPPDPSAPDYAQKKKDYDEFQAQLAKEPLAGKLADNLGHVRIATNFSWTLLTGYLVLFMQAGFALLTCGLVRKKNAAHLMMLNFAAYVFAFLAYYAVDTPFSLAPWPSMPRLQILAALPPLITSCWVAACGDSWEARAFFFPAPATMRVVSA